MVGEVFGHGHEDAAQFFDIRGVFCKGALGGDGFALVERDDRTGVDAVCLSPDGRAVLAQHLFHQFDGHFLNRVNAFYTKVAKGVVSVGAHLRNLPYRKWREKRPLRPTLDLQRTQGFGLTRGYFAHRFTGAHSE